MGEIVQARRSASICHAAQTASEHGQCDDRFTNIKTVIDLIRGRLGLEGFILRVGWIVLPPGSYDS